MNWIINLLVIHSILSVFGQKYTKEHLQKVQQISQRCAQENNLSDDIRLQFIKNSPNGKIPETDPFSCFLSCYYRSMEYVFSDGQPWKENILKKWTTVYTKQSVQEILDRCGSVGGTDLCERAYNIYSCFDDIKCVLDPMEKVN
ncbi:general odorant-binding protein 57e-like [Uranotaenia lowii]|uniref:general odorant-binding protein 57e-like n=1 Tax=Uranotaenia lowii TaxID=190385 RepID=UPI0024790631|nr:general odorant-binding protein 57e-like [Uranotaenia lowii]